MLTSVWAIPSDRPVTTTVAPSRREAYGVGDAVGGRLVDIEDTSELLEIGLAAGEQRARRHVAQQQHDADYLVSLDAAGNDHFSFFSLRDRLFPRGRALTAAPGGKLTQASASPAIKASPAFGVT